ncbi:Flp family type IVb pilin [Thalassotalea psychrophila]|uniref:Flp family type IVb pilin n=1 Tax=Thalassotalea psychrophila TaxID=3065647 RepID=A0ABY9TXN7_9GAMM|nr:Flp family type IVb pilin [Colwelliaceae bacterium SQ149]
MRNLKNLFQEFIEDEEGLTAVEYAIAGSLVVGGLVTAFSTLGLSVDSQIKVLCGHAGVSGTSDCG